ncbi:hypothetical protein VP01_2275g1, partial [Puccinia sorghi]
YLQSTFTADSLLYHGSISQCLGHLHPPTHMKQSLKSSPKKSAPSNPIPKVKQLHPSPSQPKQRRCHQLRSRKPKVPMTATPKRSERATSAPPNLTNGKTPLKIPKPTKQVAVVKPSPKQHPQQMQTGDFPSGFTPTKTALFIHIKILWGLVKQDLVPKPPELSTLQYDQRDYQNQLPQSMGHSLFSKCSGWPHQVRENNDPPREQLYKLRSSSLGSIRPLCLLASTTAYTYLKIDPEMATDMSLNIKRSSKKMVRLPKIQSIRRSAKIEKGFVSLFKDERRDFAILNKFPKQYCDILEQIAAHSDDEEVPCKGFYKIKTLPYRSKNANRLFRCLEAVRLKAAGFPKKEPVMFTFKTPPKGLPIDFYCPKWYHDLVPAQKQSIPNRNALAFLPNAKESLLPRPERHPDKKLADSTFIRKYWEVLAKPYGLLGAKSSSDEEEEDHEDESNKEGEVIDLTKPSPKNSDDDYYDEGEAGDLDDDDYDKDFVNDEEEQDDSSGSGGQSTEKDSDDDCTMAPIPEAEEDW